MRQLAPPIVFRTKPRPKLTLNDIAGKPSARSKPKPVSSNPDFIKDWIVADRDPGAPRMLTLRPDSVGWCIPDRDNPAITVIGLRNQGAKPIPIRAPHPEFAAWWRAGYPQKAKP